MPAPSLEVILKIEAAIQSAWIQILTTAGISAGQLFPEFASNPEITPRLEINLVSSKATGHYGQVLPNIFTYSAWEGDLVSRTVTRRNLNGQYHDDMIAICRREACYFLARFNSNVLPYHALSHMKEAGTHRGVYADRDEDFTELTHQVIFAVRQNAWPAFES